MKTIRCANPLRWCLALGILIVPPTLSFGGFLNFLFSSNELEAITVTDVTPAGSLRRPASPANPVYYAAVSGGFRALGGAKAGEKPVARTFVNQTVMKVLAKEGYLPARPDQRPDIILVWTWGTLNTEIMYATDGSGRKAQVNRGMLMKFMGGDKLGADPYHENQFSTALLMPGLFYFGTDAQRLYDTAGEDLYIAVITAYDAASNDARKPIKLWSTRVSSPSRGFWLDEAMPGMLAMAAPFIGRDTTKPVWVRATDKFRPDIQLGDTKLVEYLKTSTQSVVDVGAAR